MLKPTDPEEFKDALLRIHEVVKSGYAGTLPNGNIVDRREHPDALPMQKNTLMGVPEPKELGEVKP